MQLGEQIIRYSLQILVHNTENFWEEPGIATMERSQRNDIDHRPVWWDNYLKKCFRFAKDYSLFEIDIKLADR